MNLSNRIYTRKVFFRIIYMYNFYKFVLSKNIYINMAEKIETIVYWWLNKLDENELKTYDFTPLLSLKSKKLTYTIDDYLKNFEVGTKEFDDLIFYLTDNIVRKKTDLTLEYDYIVKNMNYLKQNYDEIVEKLNFSLKTFKFSEINSIDQAILLLAFVEYKTYNTPKWIIIKEAMLLSDTFSSNSKLINAVLDKSLDL